MAEYPEFELPNGVDVDLKEDGDEVEVLAKLRKKKDGKVCLIEVEGVSLGDDDYEEEESDDGLSFQDAVMRRTEGLV